VQIFILEIGRKYYLIVHKQSTDFARYGESLYGHFGTGTNQDISAPANVEFKTLWFFSFCIVWLTFVNTHCTYLVLQIRNVSVVTELLFQRAPAYVVTLPDWFGDGVQTVGRKTSWAKDVWAN